MTSHRPSTCVFQCSSSICFTFTPISVWSMRTAFMWNTCAKKLDCSLKRVWILFFSRITEDPSDMDTKTKSSTSAPSLLHWWCGRTKTHSNWARSLTPVIDNILSFFLLMIRRCMKATALNDNFLLEFGTQLSSKNSVSWSWVESLSGLCKWSSTQNTQKRTSLSPLSFLQAFFYFPSVYLTLSLTHSNHNVSCPPPGTLTPSLPPLFRSPSLCWLVTDGLIGFNKPHLHVSRLDFL